MENEQKNDIHSALARVMGTIGIVTGTGNNTHFNYKYASEHDLMMAVQPAFALEGISISKKSIDIIQYEKLGRSWHCLLSIHYVLTLSSAMASTGADRTIDQICLGAGEDPADKAVAKASTMAFKYLMRQALAIPTGDDPDATENSRAHDDDVEWVFIESRYEDRERIKAIGGARWDKEAKKWKCQDTPENRTAFADYLPAESTAFEMLESWAIDHYDGLDMMVEFCVQKSKSKTSPINWPDSQIKEFMNQMDAKNGTYSAYQKFKDESDLPPF